MTIVIDSIIGLKHFNNIFASALGSAKNVFAIIDLQSKLDPMSGIGKILDTSKMKGNIEFKDIFFNYPSRPDVKVRVST